MGKLNIQSAAYSFASVTEQTARSIMYLSGKGDKHLADQIAVETMRKTLDAQPLNLFIHLGEGEKDNAPMLYSGERLGVQKEATPRLDLVVDPLECTTNFAKGLPDSLSVLLATPSEAMRKVPGTYMEQLLVPPECLELLGSEIHLDAPVDSILKAVAKSLGRNVEDLTVVVQDRPRHEKLIQEIREAGAGVSLIESGSVSAAAEIMLKGGGRLHLVWGKFGAPEGLIMAAMANLAGYGFLGRIAPHNDAAKKECEAMGLTGRVKNASEWVGDQDIISISGVHSSTWLPGVRRYYQGGEVSYRVSTLLWTQTDVRILTHMNGELVDDQPYTMGHH